MKSLFHRSIAATFVMTLICSSQVAEASLEGARVNASRLFTTLKHLDLNVRSHYSSGLLRRGQSTIISTTLHAGNEYFLVAGGCEDAYDVDIAVFDENGNLVAQDNDIDPVAVAKITPRWSGTFRVRITMYDSTRDGAHWVLQYGYR